MIAGAGIDTWSPCWYVDRDGPGGAAMSELAVVPSKRGKLLRSKVSGHTVGWHEGSGLMWAEGHPGALCGLEGLCAPKLLPDALAGLEEALREALVPVPYGRAVVDLYGDRHDGAGGVRRCDATVDWRAPDAAVGLAVLAGVAAVAASAPRAQAEVRFCKDGSGTIETVYLRGMGGVKVLGRWYDKGLQAGTAPRGELLRIEDQRRYPFGHRREVVELADGEYVRQSFAQRFYPLWQASKGVTVAGQVVLLDKLAEAVKACGDECPDCGAGPGRQCGHNRISEAKADRLAGWLLLSSRRDGKRLVVDGGKLASREMMLSAATARRRRAELRDLGLVVADGLTIWQEVEVDLHAVIEEALETDRWGTG